MLSKEKLHGYQKESVKHIIRNRNCALFLDMGLGKTISTLTAINKLMYEDLDISSVLVVAPKRVAENVWSSECAKWSHVSHLKISRVIGNVKQRKEALKNNADIYTIGRDNIAWLCGLYGGNRLPFDMLVIDELSSFKNPKSIRFKALKPIQSCFRRVVGLTGTPAPNGLADLWSQIYLLDRGERLGKFVSQYREMYFKPGKTNGKIVFNYNVVKGGERQIYERINDICISMKAEDYLNVPKRIDNIIELDFSPEMKKKYDSFERDRCMELLNSIESDLEGTEEAVNYIDVANAAALSNKLLQFCNGAMYDEDKNWHELHNLKIDAAKDIVEEANGNSVLIAYSYRHDLERLMKALKQYNPVKLSSEQHITDWNAGKIQVMIMHPASGGHGLNLQDGGNHILWFGPTWSLELEQQFNARLHRQGQTKPVIINKLIIKGTHDMDVVNSERVKNNNQNRLMEAVKARMRKYTDIF